MEILHFVHSYNEKNGISLHVASLVESMPAGFGAQVIGGKGLSLPFFSALRFPIGEFFSALRTDFDIMHVHGYGNFYSFFGAIVCALRGKKLVWTVHGYPRIGGARRLFYYVYRYLMAPWIFWKADAIISVSEDVVPLLEKETKKEILVVPNGVDLELFKPDGEYSGAEYACYVGRLDKDKGVERMLECTQLPILFVGPDEDGMKAKLQKAAAGKNMEVEFEEAAYEEMPREYAKCRYVVLPSRYEGFPLTMLEAIACGRPFVCTDVGQVRQTLGALFEKPEMFLLDGDLQGKISLLEKENLLHALKEAREKLEKYSWKAVAQRVARIYEGLK
ncbi:D-inositol-3-phosphate glycosyltransferase [Candidatus Anstonella stagnisolia]|nr:D-inositol-3-phosphate glycosyltransferase [Candidatus Anstonella stagnisolia]